MPAAKAGINLGMKVVAVNKKRWSTDVIRAAVKTTTESAKAVDFLVEEGDIFESYRIEYAGGERHPHLVRDRAGPDLLKKIVAPLVGCHRSLK